MARPSQGYQNKGGKRVVGVTTVCSVFGDKGAIITAANKLGLDGKNIWNEWYGTASNIGTLGHDLFETFLHRVCLQDPSFPEPNLDGYTAEEIAKAETAKSAAIHWFYGSNLQIIWTEKPLVSEKLQVGGTPDALGVDHEGNYVVLDWKTGGVFGGALFQVAAYKLLIEENFPEIRINGFHIVRFAKESGDFVHRYYPELDAQAEAFPKMVELYRLIKQTEKRAA